MSDKPMNEVLYGLFYDVVRSMGLNPNPNQSENLRIRCDLLSAHMETMAIKVTGRYISKLQDRVERSFNIIESKFEAQNVLLESMKDRLAFLDALSKTNEE